MTRFQNWAMLLVAIAVLGIAETSPVDSLAAQCPTDSAASIAALNPANGLSSIKIIYVTFPDAQYGAQQLTDDQEDDIPDNVSNFLLRQSRGNYAPIVSVLPDPSNPGYMWMAQYPCTTYRSLNTAPTTYASCWSSYGENGYLGALQAEIMHTIYNTYMSQSPPLANPFQNVDMLFFVYAGGTGYSGPLGNDWDGYGELMVRQDCESWMLGLGYSTKGAVNGIVSNWRGKYLTEMTICHEVGHQLGLPHTVDSYPGVWNPDVYFFGVYSGMRAEDIDQQGCVPYHLIDLMNLNGSGLTQGPGLGWYAQADTISSDQKRLRLYDIRDETGQGKVYQINMAPFQFEPMPNVVVELPQCLLVSYHAGTNEDGELNGDGQPIVPSQGLEIWHCVGTMWDLEVASGRFDVTGGQWGDPNPTDGYDSMDAYPGREYEEYRQYAGSSSDFFSLATPSVDHPGEFSFRSNPNTYGLQYTVPDSATWKRRIPQTVENSLCIRVREERPDLGYADVDIVFAPYEDIEYPNGAETLYVGHTDTIRWSSNFASTEIDTVDILLLGCGATPDTTVIAAGIVNTSAYGWTPTSGQIMSAAKIKVVYHNTRTAITGDDESDATFAIVQWPLSFSNGSEDTGMNYAGTPYSSIALDYNGDGRKDMFIAIQNGAGSLARQTGLSENDIPQFEERAEDDFASGSGPQAGLRGVAAADYDNDGLVDFFAAAASGARLYHNNGGSFADSAAADGVSTYATNSWAGAWGDYDRDGQVDLYVCRAAGASQDPTPLNVTAENGYLLRNDVRGSGQFEAANVAAGISGTTSNASIAAAWADADGDNDADLFVGDLRSYASTPICRLYLNDGDGTFTEGMASHFAETDLDGISSVTWADMDNSGSLDLVLGSQLEPPIVFLNDGAGGFDSESTLSPGIEDPVNGVRPLDHDLDGAIDLIVLPHETSGHPWLYSNRTPTSGIELVDESNEVGLGDSEGRVDGAVAADFNHDGDQDLYLGRAVESGRFFYRATTSSGDAPTADWVGVRLVAGGGNNASAIGAKVRFRIGTSFQQLQVIDGGSGRGGQSDSTLICGLGNRTGTVEAVVKWPGGFEQTVALDRGKITTITDETTPGITSGSVSGTYTVHLGGKADWVFTWDTNYSCRPSLDKVTITDGEGNEEQCDVLGTIVLTPGSSDVEHAVVAKVAGGYRHTMTWSNVDCIAPCSYVFTVQSATDAAHESISANRAIAITICLE